ISASFALLFVTSFSRLCFGVENMSTDVIVNVGGFYNIHQRGLMPNQAYQIEQVVRKCECRLLCLTNSSCTAFSIRLHAHDYLTCLLANDNVFVNTPKIITNSVYYVRQELARSRGIDQLFYRRLMTPVQGFMAAKEACEAIPGFYLISVRFETQMRILLEICLGRKPTSGETQCTDPALWFY
ncbi:PAN/Apple domain, partial [Trinorchestia longiramus]